MQNQPIALVTGANKGIGLQIAKDLAAHGFIVLVGLPRTGSSASAIPATTNNIADPDQHLGTELDVKVRFNTTHSF